MSEITRILASIQDGNEGAAERLLPLVYDALRKLAAAKLARENPGHTLEATALVHEAYIRLVDAEKAKLWNSRGHFFAAAAEAMRRILIESARKKAALKRGAGLTRVDLEQVDIVSPANPERLLLLAEFMTLEALCCPFFTLALQAACDGGPLRLRITGPDGVKPFIRAELGIPDPSAGASSVT